MGEQSGEDKRAVAATMYRDARAAYIQAGQGRRAMERNNLTLLEKTKRIMAQLDEVNSEVGANSGGARDDPVSARVRGLPGGGCY